MFGVVRTTNFKNTEDTVFPARYPKDNYDWINFDSGWAGVMTKPQACALAKNIRASAALYGKMTVRPYEPFGQTIANSNSFAEAVSLRAKVPEKYIISLPPAPNEGQYTGWMYWRNQYPSTPVAWKVLPK